MNRRSVWGQVVARANEFTILTSPDIRSEIVGVIERPELHERLSRWAGTADTAVVLSLLDESESVDPDVVAPVCRDANDDIYFACAAAGSADYIVSEDEDVLAIAEYEGARTVRAAAFLELLDVAR